MSENRAAPGGSVLLAPGLEVSRIGLGTNRLLGPHGFGHPKDRLASLAVLRRAVELGITHIDSGERYRPRVANGLIREAIQPCPADLVVATTAGVEEDGWRSPYAYREARALAGNVDNDLSELGREQLDLVLLFGGVTSDNDGVPLPQGLEVLADLRERGLIRHIGLNECWPEGVSLACGITPIAAVQADFDLFRPQDDDLRAACRERGVVFVARYESADEMLRTADEEQLRALDAVATRHAATRAQTALAWLLARYPSDAVLLGARTVAELEENVAAGRLRLTPTDLARLARP
ncbi:aldo/keto reductase [Streptomyces griseocarneus]|uniref:aldo/keto reductase n=1 Tax=Streptomyces griseocarneus TaxID=51201 RepID=UPI00167F0D03|nr:aldo/keto reductase [Streptomyces griseocarneus]MBZ6476390.1 aldo/keto reductase [Streptomyces griseocarneus]GHG79206.1 oxidoreductase [Streptomyces griseocarneus]